MSFTPAAASLRGRGRLAASGIPTAFGPTLRRTRTLSGSTLRSGSSRAAVASSVESKTMAGPCGGAVRHAAESS